MNVGHANTCLSLLSTVFTVIAVQCKIVCIGEEEVSNEKGKVGRTITVCICMNVRHENTWVSLLSTVSTVIVVECKIVCVGVRRKSVEH